MATPKTILVERDGRVLTITLNRPEKLNAYNQEMKEELRAAWCEVRDDPDVWCSIVTGAGRAFSSGAAPGHRVCRRRYPLAADP